MSLRIWLVTIGEPWPTDGSHPRLLRTGVMAQLFASRGDDVVWFNGTFDHTGKTHRYEKTTVVSHQRLTIVGLYGARYQQNISLARVRHHRQVAQEFTRVASGMARPDVIVASMPPLELSLAAVQMGRTWGVPVVVDVRDLWPDIFLDVFPKWSRGAARHALAPFYDMLTTSIEGASAVVGISDRAVEWALSHAGRSRSHLDGSLPMAYAADSHPSDAVQEADRYWDSLGVVADQFNASFVGTFSRRIELDTVIDAARSLASIGSQVRFVLAGGGERETDVRESAGRLPNVVIPGWQNAPRIEALLNRSKVGLLPYPSEVDFTRSIPNKVFDYLHSGVPIVTSAQGVTSDLLKSHDCGWTYPNADSTALADLLARLERSRDTVSNAAAATRAVRAEFDAAAVYGRFRDTLEALVARARSRRYAS